ncbi:hypothetical protein QWM81_11465, partial [Streptomyces ficellus]
MAQRRAPPARRRRGPGERAHTPPRAHTATGPRAAGGGQLVPGRTATLISHDRFFIERTTDRTYALLGDATLRMLPRGIDEYLERRQRM